MKLNLLKKLLTLSPVVISPILVTACGSSDNGGEKTDITKVTAPGKFYLDFYQRELNAIWATKTAEINAAASDTAANHQYDLGINLVDAVLPKVKADGAAEFKKEFPKLDNYDASLFDNITVSFAIPNDSKGNLKLADNSILSIYPASVVSGKASEKHIDYTLKLNSSKAIGKELSGSLKFNLQAGFVNYDDSTSSPLANNTVLSVYGNSNLSTILIGTLKGGLDVGTRQADGSYTFSTYNSSSSGKEKLANNDVYGVYGNDSMSTIFIGEYGGGLDVGTKQADGSYNFKNYKKAQGLVNDYIFSIYGTPDLSTILVGTYLGGLDVGTKQGDGTYKFVNYNKDSAGSSALADNSILSSYGNADLSTILLGTYGGLNVGTRQAGGDYTFDKYNTSSSGSEKLASNAVYSVYGSTDLSTILVGENGVLDGGLDVGTKQANGRYTFVDYNKDSAGSSALSEDDVNTVYGNTDLSTILVGEVEGGLDVGTKQGDGTYKFDNYNKDSATGALSNATAKAIYGTADLSTILVGTYLGGLDISSNLWFA